MKVWIAAKMTGTNGEQITKFGSQISNRNEAIIGRKTYPSEILVYQSIISIKLLAS